MNVWAFLFHKCVILKQIRDVKISNIPAIILQAVSVQTEAINHKTFLP